MKMDSEQQLQKPERKLIDKNFRKLAVSSIGILDFPSPNSRLMKVVLGHSQSVT